MKSFTASPAIHADGYRDFHQATDCRAKLREEEIRLRRRIHRWCHAESFAGDLRIWIFRQRVQSRLRRKIYREEALFLANRSGLGWAIPRTSNH